MGLEQYRRQRMIVLQPLSTAYDAARAMVDNHVGALLVAGDQALGGVVTDRDLVCEVMAAGLDPTMVPLGEVMSSDVVSVDIGADVAAVVALMSKHACRRIPVVESGKAVGLVTLDDLLLEGAIDAHTAAEIIRAQLETPARYKRSGATHPEVPARVEVSPRGGRALTRRNARAAASYARLLKLVEQRTQIADRAQAELGLKIVLGSICRRLPPEEARHAIAQLPSVLKEGLGAHLDGPNRQITRATIESEIAAVLGVSRERAAEIAVAVSESIADSVSQGEVAAMMTQLPRAMRELFPAWNVTRKEAEQHRRA